MSNTETKVLILGHSFVRRFKRDLNHCFDPRARRDFNLTGTASVCLHGVGGRTVDKLQRFDLNFVKETCPEIIILEIGTNDLSYEKPEIVGSSIDDLVLFILSEIASVRVVGVCHVIPRGINSSLDAKGFFRKAKILNQYVRVVLSQYSNVFCWEHKQFNSIFKDLYLSDGCHLNKLGQYFLYRSYRGAIMRALTIL